MVPGRLAEARAHVGALLVLVTIFVVAIPPSAQAAWQVPGIDVSKYQGEIRWREVAAANIRFAVIRATLGNDYRDPRYAENPRARHTHGLAVGAYHFAEPSGGAVGTRSARPITSSRSPGWVEDSLPGPRHRVVERPVAGKLRVWAVAWLNRVHRGGRCPADDLSGNHFWRGSDVDTPWFGLRSHALWVAHWDVELGFHASAAGRATMWQWSACGRVPGIRGPVDLDRVPGTWNVVDRLDPSGTPSERG